MVIVPYKRREILGYNINGSSVESVRRDNVLCGQCYFYTVLQVSWSILIKGFWAQRFYEFLCTIERKTTVT